MSDSKNEPTTLQPPQSWQDLKPWTGKATRADKLLLGTIMGIVVLMLATLPLRPFLLARNPVLLEFLTGSLSAIGAGAAFARIGETSLWLVIVAGIVGMIKFDWLFWLAGRRWGIKIVSAFAPNERSKRWVARSATANPWLARGLMLISALPGVPAAMVFTFAGMNRMRLSTFLLLNTISASIMVGLLAGLGYSLGQQAVDVVLLIDRYAVWISIALVVGVALWSGGKARNQSQPESATTPTATESDPTTDRT